MHPAEAARRIRRFEATLDPRTLWPDVTEAQVAAAMRELVRVTAVLLPEEEARAEIAARVAGSAALGVAAFASGLGPLLGYWIERGRLRAEAEVEALLVEHLRHGRRRATRLRTELERLAQMFGAEGIGITVLKGMHTGWVYFPEPGTRPAGDLDVLIDQGRAADARRLLEAAGFQLLHGMAERTTWMPPGSPEPASVTLTHADNPCPLDLHVTIDRRFANAPIVARLGLRPAEDLAPWTVGAAPVHVLTQPLLTCFLAVHAAHHFPIVPALRMVELALVVRRDDGPALWRGVRERLAATGAGPFAYPGLKLTADLQPGVVDASLLEALRGDTPPRVRDLTGRLGPATALQLYRRSFEVHFLWSGSRWRRLTGFVRWLWPRDSDGGRLPVRDAVRVTGQRLRRLVTGLFSWRHR